jgi:hypothetical protein
MHITVDDYQEKLRDIFQDKDADEQVQRLVTYVTELSKTATARYQRKNQRRLIGMIIARLIWLVDVLELDIELDLHEVDLLVMTMPFDAVTSTMPSLVVKMLSHWLDDGNDLYFVERYIEMLWKFVIDYAGRVDTNPVKQLEKFIKQSTKFVSVDVEQSGEPTSGVKWTEFKIPDEMIERMRKNADETTAAIFDIDPEDLKRTEKDQPSTADTDNGFTLTARPLKPKLD